MSRRQHNGRGRNRRRPRPAAPGRPAPVERTPEDDLEVRELEEDPEADWRRTGLDRGGEGGAGRPAIDD